MIYAKIVKKQRGSFRPKE